MRFSRPLRATPDKGFRLGRSSTRAIFIYPTRDDERVMIHRLPMPGDEESLHDAAQLGDRDLLQELLKHGADPNTFDEIGKTPLHYAAEREDIDMMRMLLAGGADVNAHDEAQIGNTVLRQVAESCSLQVAKLLVDAGADPTIEGWMRLTAIDKAASRKRGDGPAVYRLLVERVKRTKAAR